MGALLSVLATVFVIVCLVFGLMWNWQLTLVILAVVIVIGVAGGILAYKRSKK